MAGKIAASISNSFFELFQFTPSSVKDNSLGENLQSFSSRVDRRTPFRFIKNSGPFLLILLVVVVVLFFVGTKLVSKNVGINTKDERTQAPLPKAKQTLNKEFVFAIKDDKGKEVSKIKYFLEEASLMDQIIVKGELARAVKGRTFLIINLKLTNTYNQGVQINSKDFIRLSVNRNSELLAPDIHNDPVQVQAISTKFTRVGFPINDIDKNLVLQVGEIEGKKEQIKLNFK